MSLDKLIEKAVALHSSGDLQQAEIIYRQVLEKAPDHPDATHFMGVLAYNAGKNDIAKLFLKKAIELLPNHAGPFNNMGNVFQAEKQYDKAKTFYKMAIEINPKHRMAHNNLGVACLHSADLDNALISIDKALSIDPGYVEAIVNRGEVLRAMGDYDKAIEDYERAIAISPDCVDAHWNRSVAWLTQGRFLKGWAEYEWRWKRKETPCRAFATGKPWQGQDISGKVVFVYEEQGLGDTLQFIRYLPLVWKLGCRLVFEVNPALIRLVNANRLYDRLLVGLKDVDTRPVDRFDYHVSLLSLPKIFQTEVETIPAKVPYLSPEPSLCKIWRNRFVQDGSFKVGIVWAGHPGHKNDSNRSIPLKMFEQFSRVDGVSLYSLQKDKHDKWTDNESLRMFTKDFGPEISDFSDTAAIMDNLDLVISVDTSVVHLAGAMGKQVWNLVPFCPDFRWLLETESSPWYPTMRLFRQPAPGDWNSVFQKVVSALMNAVD